MYLFHYYTDHFFPLTGKHCSRHSSQVHLLPGERKTLWNLLCSWTICTRYIVTNSYLVVNFSIKQGVQRTSFREGVYLRTLVNTCDEGAASFTCIPQLFSQSNPIPARTEMRRASGFRGAIKERLRSPAKLSVC